LIKKFRDVLSGTHLVPFYPNPPLLTTYSSLSSRTMVSSISFVPMALAISNSLSLFQSALSIKSIKSLAPLLDRVLVQRAKVVEVSPRLNILCSSLSLSLNFFWVDSYVLENRFGIVPPFSSIFPTASRRYSLGSRSWCTRSRRSNRTSECQRR